MVHALKEAWRVLVPHGIMIDLRPVCIDVPLEIVHTGGIDSAGVLDFSSDIQRDIDSAKALDLVLIEGIYQETRLEFFDFAYYWNTLKGMREDLDEYWIDEIVIPEAVWSQAKLFIKQRRPKAKIRIAVRMKLGLYTKQ